MKLRFNFALATIILLSSCGSESEDPQAEKTGNFLIEFENFIGTTPVTLVEEGSTDYMYTTSSGEPFNIDLFKYYISKVILEGPNGEYFEDEINVSPNADEVKGFYLVDESNESSKYISLQNVPAGTYNKIRFTVGIDEEGIEEGAAGGVLDPASGAMFWNWNAGYIGLSIEGAAENSSQVLVEGPDFTIYDHSYEFHVGGWKDIQPAEGEPEKFVNNLKEIALEFDSNVQVADGLVPEAHIIMDALKVLDGVNIDFATTYIVHSPKSGESMANQLPNAFILDHIHQ